MTAAPYLYGLCRQLYRGASCDSLGSQISVIVYGTDARWSTQCRITIPSTCPWITAVNRCHVPLLWIAAKSPLRRTAAVGKSFLVEVLVLVLVLDFWIFGFLDFWISLSPTDE